MPLGRKAIQSQAARSVRTLVGHEQSILFALAIVTGLAASAGAAGFRELLGLFQWLAFGTGADDMVDFVTDLPWWHRLAMPALGGLLVGLFIHRFVAGGRPVAVPQVMEASALRGGRMSLTQGIKGAIANAATLGFGGSSGREGPIVHLGATIGSRIAKSLRLDRQQARTLLACGVAGAVAASFNAPLAGAFFALEVVLGHYALAAFAPIVVASLVATVVSREIYGAYPAFIIPEYSFSVWEFPAFGLVGVCAAVLAVAFMRSIAAVEDLMQRLPGPVWARPALGGLGVGLIAVAFPEVLGVGYGPTDSALKGELALWLLLGLVVAKTAAAALTIGSGFGGGIFSPALFLGAVLGGAVGTVAGAVAPYLFFADATAVFAGAGAYAMVGMGAVAGAVLGAPISTILIIFELTGDYQLTMAVMLGTVIATVITQQWHGTSFFRGALQRRGVDIDRRVEADLLQTQHVETVMSTQFSKVNPGTGLAELRLYLKAASYNELFVVAEDGRLVGTITLADFDQEALFDHVLDDVVIAYDVARRHPPMLEMRDNLHDAIRLMATVQEEHIPVVNNRRERRLVGFVHEKDVMLAYNQALVRLHREQGAAF